jgi:hypothetical protein
MEIKNKYVNRNVKKKGGCNYVPRAPVIYTVEYVLRVPLWQKGKAVF